MSRLFNVLLFLVLPVLALADNVQPKFRTESATIGTSTTPATNVKLHRGATGLQLVPGNDSAVDGADASSFKPLTVSALTSSSPSLFADGSAASPSISFTNSNTTGVYRAGTDIIGFSTAGAEKARLLANGNLGIGTATPAQKLDVNGTANISGNLSLGTGLISNSAGGNKAQISSSNAWQPEINGGLDLGSDAVSWSNLYVVSGSSVDFDAGSSTNLVFDGAGNSVKPSVNAGLDLGTSSLRWSSIYGTNAWISSNIGVGTTSATQKLQVAGNGTYDGFIDIGQGSQRMSGTYAAAPSDTPIYGGGGGLLVIQDRNDQNTCVLMCALNTGSSAGTCTVILATGGMCTATYNQAGVVGCGYSASAIRCINRWANNHNFGVFAAVVP